jgi:hypothetical protein
MHGFTSKKNFFAPTTSAFFRAASKSFQGIKIEPDRWSGMENQDLFLANVSHESVHLIALLDEPRENARCI